MYDAPTPRPISVNILGLRFTSDAQNRSRNGHPHHSTTGVASASSPHRITSCGSACIAHGSISRSNGIVSASPIQNRRVISRSSGFSSSTAAPNWNSGSSAMPHFGHAPGLSDTTSGSIGQTYLVPFGADFAAPIAPNITIPAPGAFIGDAPGFFKYFSGSALNFVTHPGEQK